MEMWPANMLNIQLQKESLKDPLFMRSIFYRHLINNLHLLHHHNHHHQPLHRLLQQSCRRQKAFSSSSYSSIPPPPLPRPPTPPLLPTRISSSLSSPPSFIMQTSADATGVTIIDGKATADTIREELKLRVDRLSASAGRAPGLAVVLVGARPDSATYVRMKKKACAMLALGVYSPVEE